jgi:hypothetical protein
MIFLTQSYFKVSTTIRAQLSYLMLLKVSSDQDLKRVLRDYSLGISPEELADMHQEATNQKFSFLKIDIQTANKDKKFSKNFTDFF